MPEQKKYEIAVTDSQTGKPRWTGKFVYGKDELEAEERAAALGYYRNLLVEEVSE